MTKTINECIYGLKKGIIDAGLSSATSDSYCRTIIALMRKSKYSLDDDCTEFVIEDLLKCKIRLNGTPFPIRTVQ